LKKARQNVKSRSFTKNLERNSKKISKAADENKGVKKSINQ